MSVDVYVSVGKTYTNEQETFVRAIEDQLRREGLNPRTPNRNEFTDLPAFEGVRKVMRECAAVLVIAFERIRVIEGIEFPGSDTPISRDGASLATPWNQIEGAMGWILGRPLFVIAVDDVLGGGILDNGPEWTIRRVRMSPSAASDPELSGAIHSFAERARTAASQGTDKPVDLSGLTLGQVVSSMRPGGQFRSFTAAVAAFVVAVSAAVTAVVQLLR